MLLWLRKVNSNTMKSMTWIIKLLCQRKKNDFGYLFIQINSYGPLHDRAHLPKGRYPHIKPYEDNWNTECTVQHLFHNPDSTLIEQTVVTDLWYSTCYWVVDANSATEPDGFPVIPLKSYKRARAKILKFLFQSFLASSTLVSELKDRII